MRGACRLPDRRPAGPAMTSFTSSHVDTMQNTMSQRGEIGHSIGDLRAVLRERLGLRPRAIPHGDVGAALGEALRHRVAHASVPIHPSFIRKIPI